MKELLIPAAKRICNKANLYRPSWEIPHIYRTGWDIYLRDNQDKMYDRLLITVPFKPRSTGKGSQNHHVNSHIQDIAHSTGNNFDSVKMAMKTMAISEGYPFDTVSGVVVPWSETRLDTVQCAILITFIHRWADENGIAVREDGLGLL